MLAKKYRLKKNSDFELTFKNGFSAKEDYLIVHFINNGLGLSRLAVAVKKGAAPNNPIKNKTKRAIGEFLRINLKRIKTGFDIVVVSAKTAKDKEFKNRALVLEKALKKAGLFKS